MAGPLLDLPFLVRDRLQRFEAVLRIDNSHHSRFSSGRAYQ